MHLGLEFLCGFGKLLFLYAQIGQQAFAVGDVVEHQFDGGQAKAHVFECLDAVGCEQLIGGVIAITGEAVDVRWRQQTDFVVVPQHADGNHGQL